MISRWSLPVRSGAPLVASLVYALAGCANAGGNTFAPPPGSSSTSTGATSIGGASDAGAGLSALGVDASLGGIGDASSIVGSTSSTFTGPLAGPFTDFPSTPILDMPDGGAAAAPANSAPLFGPASQGASSGGPCLLEPEVGSIYPNNWLRPRFAWIAPSGGANLFELRLHVNNQTNDLLVYTTATEWTMPKAMWDGLRADSQDVPMTITLRSGQLNGSTLSNEALGSSGSVGIAPVGAPGAIVYWAILGGQGGTGILEGFSVGDETVETVLTGPQVQENAAPTGNRACIGCHAATPDGLGVGFQAEWLGPGGYNNTIASIGMDASPGGVPGFLSAAAGTELGVLAGAPIYSVAHWTTGDRIEILSNTGNLTWVDLEATGANVSGMLARSLGADGGDLQAATSPTWSHDGSTIVYTSLPASGIVDGRPSNGPMDLYAVPYGAKAGGNAVPIVGASDPLNDEFYPAFSPDDQYLAFDKLEGNGGTYDAPGDQIYVVPSGGGASTRLGANDPPACTGATSPGVTNSWPRWSPSAQTVAVLNNTTYYWIVFSSTRPNIDNIGQQAVPQLYISLLTVDTSGAVTSYHSLYLWNQPSNEDNHLPAWDVFQIPPVSSTIPR